MKFAIVVTFVIANGFSSLPALAQIKALSIGDTLPHITLKSFNSEKSEVKTADLRGRLLILDFWSTYCLPCIAAFPKIDSLQKKFKDQATILPVADQSNALSIIPGFWRSNPVTRKLSLFTAIDEKQILLKYFPRSGVPHVVWVDQNGIVKAVTTSQYLNQRSIEALLDNETIDWATSNVYDTGFDYSRSLLARSTSNSNYSIGHSIIIPYLKNVHSKSEYIIDTAARQIRYLEINTPILSMYRNTLQGSDLYLKLNRQILEIKDSSKYYYDDKKEYYEDWMARNSFCYELMCSSISKKRQQIQQNVREDLNRFLGINGRVENRIVDCLVLQQDENKNAVGKKISNRQAINSGEFLPLSKLVEDLNMKPNNPPILMGEVKDKEMLVSVPYDQLNDIKAVQKKLDDYGLYLVLEKRKLEVFVLTDL